MVADLRHAQQLDPQVDERLLVTTAHRDLLNPQYPKGTLYPKGTHAACPNQMRGPAARVSSLAWSA
jgi:hypothetical protein